MITIWKFETLVGGEFKEKFTLKMPEYAKILTIQRDEKTNIPCIWAEVNTDNETVERHFELFGTGHEIHYDMGVDRQYLGTYQYQKGEFVGHIYERHN